MPELQQLVDDLVAANHILYHHGVVDGYGHASIRHPENPERFLIAAAIAPGRVRASDILELDLDGKPIGAAGRPLYSERFIHAEVYRARSDVNAVIHSHSPTVIPFSVTDVPLRPIINQASCLHSGVPVFNSRFVPEATSPLVDSPPVGKALVATLGEHSVVLMRGHGNTIVAPGIREAVSRAIYTERNAQLLLQTLALNRPIEYLDPNEVRTMTSNRQTTTAGPSHGVDRIWQMWLDEIKTQGPPAATRTAAE
jgi:ribulose-5-phosphate 4-epimerase/fuculose-1-phosphate aldolase